MRFSSLLPALTILSSVFFSTVDARSPAKTRTTRTIKPAVLRTRDTTLNSGLHEFEKRAIVTGCATVAVGTPIISLQPLSVIDIDLGSPVVVSLNQTVCLCLQAGALTTASVARLLANIGTSGNVNLAGLGLGDITVVNGLITSAATTLLGDQQPSVACTYPTGAIPESCTTCGYRCPGTQVNCKGVCSSSCTSADITPRVARRRGLSAHLLCANNFSACAVAGRGEGRFECIDTSRNVDSCGGCDYPLAGEKQGEDCTAIDNVADVSCVHGRCVVEACMKGFINVYGKCVLP